MGANVVVLNQGYDHSFQAREQLLIERLASLTSWLSLFRDGWNPATASSCAALPV